MAETTHFGIPKPVEGPDVSVADEFYRLQLAWDIVDAAMKLILDTASGKAPLDHGHPIEAITGLVDALQGKMPADQTFGLDDLTDVDGAQAAPSGYVLVKTSTGWVPFSAAAAIGQHGHPVSDIAGLADLLAGFYTKTQADARYVDIAGDTMTGQLRIKNVAPVIFLEDTDWGTRAVHHQDGLIGFLNSSGSWALNVDNAGAVWTQQFGDLATAIGARVAKAGDVMTGMLAISYANPRIRLENPGQRIWDVDVNLTNFRIVDRTANHSRFQVAIDGSVWTSRPQHPHRKPRICPRRRAWPCMGQQPRRRTLLAQGEQGIRDHRQSATKASKRSAGQQYCANRRSGRGRRDRPCHHKDRQQQQRSNLHIALSLSPDVRPRARLVDHRGCIGRDRTNHHGHNKHRPLHPP